MRDSERETPGRGRDKAFAPDEHPFPDSSRPWSEGEPGNGSRGHRRREAEMAGGMRRTGIAVAALSLLVVAGSISAAYADDRGSATATICSDWKGVDEEIHPVAPGTKVDSDWRGLDEEVHPVAPGARQAGSTESEPASSGIISMPLFALGLGLGLAGLIAGVAVAYRRRTRPVHAG
jgi:hypothetical protein